ncbi:Rid family detoxifying hydrolase [Halococcus sediminicola]|uniref:Rid family detoxifying hydrolase n=1 Tax=Halococcus sediminicola TaxID=1264579 RepID=UPI000678E3D0|nr:Rid family detoxifying hydrolase [Halococcus sediminicola]
MEELSTDDAPDSIGPYSQGIISGERIYVSGQGPVDPDTGDVVSGTPEEQTKRTLENVEAILEAGGVTLEEVVKSTIYTKDMRYYDEINRAYSEHMVAPYPARSAVEVVRLPVDIDVEIEVVAER